MWRYLLLLAGWFTCVGIQAQNLTQASQLLREATGAQVRNYSTRDFGRERYNGAVSALVPADKAETLLRVVRKRLPTGLVAYVGTTNSLASPPAQGVEIIVGPGGDTLDILEIARTDAVNHGMDTKQVRDKLAQWHKNYGIDIWQAETDTVQLKFKRLPKDLPAFAREVYAFCPDIVDQGLGTTAALEQAIRQESGLLLWWD
jgi:hypothetical protein